MRALPCHLAYFPQQRGLSVGYDVGQKRSCTWLDISIYVKDACTMLVWNMPAFNLKKPEQARGVKRASTPGTTMVKNLPLPRPLIMIYYNDNEG